MTYRKSPHKAAARSAWNEIVRIMWLVALLAVIFIVVSVAIFINNMSFL